MIKKYKKEVVTTSITRVIPLVVKQEINNTIEDICKPYRSAGKDNGKLVKLKDLPYIAIYIDETEINAEAEGENDKYIIELIIDTNCDFTPNSYDEDSLYTGSNGSNKKSFEIKSVKVWCKDFEDYIDISETEEKIIDFLVKRRIDVS